MKTKTLLFAAMPLAILAGCVTVPNGPTVVAMPGSGKTYDQFRADDYNCQQEARNQVGTSPNDAATNAAIGSAAVGTVVGGLIGAAVGGHEGAAVGAGAGLLVGGSAGADAANRSAYSAQRRYDAVYSQCMYGHGEQIPVAQRAPAPRYAPPQGYYPPPPQYPPPPPAGYYPPPPPQ